MYKQLVSGQNQFQHNAFFIAGALEGSRRLSNDLIDVKICFIKDGLSVSAVLIELDQSACQLGQMLRLRDDNVQLFILHLHRDRSVEHRFHIALTRSQRRAKIM